MKTRRTSHKVYGVWEYDFIMYKEQQFLQTTQQILQ